MTTTPISHAEAVALFRLSVLGDMVGRDLAHGELKVLLAERAKLRWRPPSKTVTRRFGASTIERWYYAHKAGGIRALYPAGRKDRGHARRLSDQQRKLIKDIRRAHPSASVPLILENLVGKGLIEHGAVSESALRRMLGDAGLSRKRRVDIGKVRRRWEAEHPGALWHGDVCHTVEIDIDGKPRRVLVHGFVDDSSRLLLSLEGRLAETEADMLHVLSNALMMHGPPRALYLDNGSCYSGKLLELACARLNIKLIHAAPYDAPARGKMERLWRTMREQCIDHLPGGLSLHDINVRLWAWMDSYNRRPHASLMGNSPRERHHQAKDRLRPPLDRDELLDALSKQVKRRVKRDGTFQINGLVYEALGRHLSGQRITVTLHPFDGTALTASHQGKAIELNRCDPVANARSRRPTPSTNTDDKSVDFDPSGDLLRRANRKQGQRQ